MRHSVIASLSICALLVFGAPVLAGDLSAPPAVSSGPMEVTASGPTYFVQPGAEMVGLDHTFGWLVDFHGVDMSGMSRGSEVRFGLQNAGGMGGESLAVAVMLDAPGPDAVTLRAVEGGGSLAGPVARSGHEFEAGSFSPESFDLRMHMTDGGGGAWNVDASYRAAGSTGWESFEDGSFTTTDSFDVTGGSFFAAVDQGSGTLRVDEVVAVHNPEPGTILLLGAGLVGLGLYTRRRKKQ